MDPTYDITPGLLNNKERFTNPFFSRFTLRPDRQPLRLSDTVSKDYLFPTLYGDVTQAVAVFPCSYRQVCQLMPHRDMHPVKLTRQRAAVIISCYIYQQVLGVAPYNEIALTIPVMVKTPVNPPVLPMLYDKLPGFGYYVFSMPVTSLENQIRGRRIWGLPKVVQRIDIETRDGWCVTRAFEEGTGEQYLELRVPTTGKMRHFDTGGYLYSRHEGAFIRSRTAFAGDYAMNLNPLTLLLKDRRPAAPVLTLGSSPCGMVLKNLHLEATPLQTRFATGVSSCFDLPEPGYRSPLKD